MSKIGDIFDEAGDKIGEVHTGHAVAPSYISAVIIHS